MTPASLTSRAVPAPVSALWAAATWRATANALAGLLAALSIVVVIVFPVLTPWVAQGPTALQRSRLRATLGAEIPPPARSAGRAPWPVGPWLAPGTWRQLGFHGLAVLTGAGGGSLVAAC